MVIDKNGNIDFQVWNVPTSWDEVTLQQLCDIRAMYADKSGATEVDIIEILHILTNHTKEEVEELPLSFVNSMLDKMSFLAQPLPEHKPSNKVTIDGVTYVVNNEREMKTAEFIASQMAIKDDETALPTLLAIVARKAGEEYTSEYENKVLPERIEIFKKASCTAVMPLVSFFLTLWLVLEQPSQLSSLVREEIEDLTASLTESSQNAGLGKRLSIRWQKRKLRKLKDSLDGMF